MSVYDEMRTYAETAKQVMWSTGLHSPTIIAFRGRKAVPVLFAGGTDEEALAQAAGHDSFIFVTADKAPDPRNPGHLYVRVETMALRKGRRYYGTLVSDKGGDYFYRTGTRLMRLWLGLMGRGCTEDK